MKIEDVLRTINQMQADGVVERYAIGGAVAATFYLEPVATLDVDVFVESQPERASMIEGEHGVRGRRRVDCMGRVVTRPSDREIASQYVIIAGWPVQFLPAGNPLLQEALATAVEKDVEDTSVRVFTPEHIVAIALETGRAKDKARVLQFIEANAVDLDRVGEILTRHGLSGQWEKFERQFIK